MACVPVGTKRQGRSRTSQTETDTADTALSEEDTDSEPPTETETERVSDRPDYVGFQDLDIEKYVTLADYKKF